MEGKRAPSRAIRLMVRDTLIDVQRCGRPADGDDWAHFVLGLACELRGAMRYCLRSDPVSAADAVSADRWRNALMHLAATDPSERADELTRLLARAHTGRTPLEVNS